MFATEFQATLTSCVEARRVSTNGANYLSRLDDRMPRCAALFRSARANRRRQALSRGRTAPAIARVDLQVATYRPHGLHGVSVNGSPRGRRGAVNSRLRNADEQWRAGVARCPGLSRCHPRTGSCARHALHMLTSPVTRRQAASSSRRHLRTPPAGARRIRETLARVLADRVAGSDGARRL